MYMKNICYLDVFDEALTQMYKIEGSVMLIRTISGVRLKEQGFININYHARPFH